MRENLTKQVKRVNRHRRVRAKISGTAEVPRLSVYRSNKNIFLQLIDDGLKKTLVSENDIKKDKKKITKIESAKSAGRKLAELALKKNIIRAVFDKGGYSYHGRVKAAAEGAREGGLKF